MRVRVLAVSYLLTCSLTGCVAKRSVGPDRERQVAKVAVVTLKDLPGGARVVRVDREEREPLVLEEGGIVRIPYEARIVERASGAVEEFAPHAVLDLRVPGFLPRTVDVPLAERVDVDAQLALAPPLAPEVRVGRKLDSVYPPRLASGQLLADRAYEHLLAGRYDEALAAYQAIFDATQDPDALYYLAECQRLAGLTREAIDSYLRYLRRNPAAPNRAAIVQQVQALKESP